MVFKLYSFTIGGYIRGGLRIYVIGEGIDVSIGILKIGQGVKAGDTEVHLVILKRKFCVKIEIPAILLLGLCGKLGIIQFLTTIFT